MKGFSFGSKRIGQPDDSSKDEEEGSDESKGEKKKDDFGSSATEMAVRALAKAFGLDPDEVDTAKASRALSAIVSACKDKNEEEDSY